jgi:hypothetical protein
MTSHPDSLSFSKRIKVPDIIFAYDIEEKKGPNCCSSAGA